MHRPDTGSGPTGAIGDATPLALKGDGLGDCICSAIVLAPSQWRFTRLRVLFALLDSLSARGELSGYHLLPAARADLLRRLGRPSEAAAAYRAALGLVTNPTERRFLERRLEMVAEASRTSR